MAYTIKAHEISSVIRRQIAQYNEDMRVVNVGTVFQVGDGIARIYVATRNYELMA